MKRPMLMAGDHAPEPHRPRPEAKEEATETRQGEGARSQERLHQYSLFEELQAHPQCPSPLTGAALLLGIGIRTEKLKNMEIFFRDVSAGAVLSEGAGTASGRRAPCHRSGSAGNR